VAFFIRSTPTYECDVAVPGQFRNAQQFSVHFVPELDLLPQPPAICLNHLISCSVAPTAKRIAQHTAGYARHLAADIDAITTICSLILDVSHGLLLSLTGCEQPNPLSLKRATGEIEAAISKRGFPEAVIGR
jgi:hypothetical protein